MLPVQIEITNRRRWILFRRRRFIIQLPQTWSEVPAKKRGRWWRWLMQENRRRILRDAVGLPRWLWHMLTIDELTTLQVGLSWMQLQADCVDPVITEFSHRGVTYYLPKEKGQNLACIEYPMADSFFMKSDDGRNQEELLNLVATLCRPARSEEQEVLSSGDRRVPLNSRDEVRARAAKLKGLPEETATAVLLYFAGLKIYVHKTYGKWLFDDDQDTDDDKPKGPNFGWWGIYQDVAKSGVFGKSVKDVHQSSFHEVCMYLVRQKIQEDEISQAASESPVQKQNNDDDI